MGGEGHSYSTRDGGPTMVGSDKAENFLNFSPLEWPQKSICQANIWLLSIVLNRGSTKSLQ